MFGDLIRALLGPAGSLGGSLQSELAELNRPGRPPVWPAPADKKLRPFKAKAPFVEPFFNHVAGDTRRQRAA